MFGKIEVQRLDLSRSTRPHILILSLGQLELGEITWNKQLSQELTLFSLMEGINVGVAHTLLNCNELNSHQLRIHAAKEAIINGSIYSEACELQIASEPLWKEKALLGFRLSRDQS